jgi:mRNA interferase MazF
MAPTRLNSWNRSPRSTRTRGDVVIVADRRGEFTGKPRPALVVQSDAFRDAPTVPILPLTSDGQMDAPLLHIPVPADKNTGLSVPSWARIELIAAVRRRHIGPVIGRADDATMLAVNRALVVFLKLA